jgi:hypothetical protein
LFPEPSAVLAGELARQGIDPTQSFDGHKEGLVLGESHGAEIRDLVAEMFLELVDVSAVDGGSLRHEGAPLRDLEVDARRAHASPHAG